MSSPDIRPWISIGEAVGMALDTMLRQQETAYASWKADPRRKIEAPKKALRRIAERFPS